MAVAPNSINEIFFDLKYIVAILMFSIKSQVSDSYRNFHKLYRLIDAYALKVL